MYVGAIIGSVQFVSIIFEFSNNTEYTRDILKTVTSIVLLLISTASVAIESQLNVLRFTF